MLQKQTVSVELLELLIGLKSDEIFKDYVLGGGTALTLQIGHRKSYDIDLFKYGDQDNKKILEHIEEKYKNYELLNINKNVLELKIKNIKVDFIGMYQTIIDDPIEEEGITLFGINDISAMKLRAIIYRTQPRDYIDIAYLLKKINFEKMLEMYKLKFNNQDIYTVKMALIASKNIEKKDWTNDIIMLKNEINNEKIPAILMGEVNRYNKAIGIKTKIGKFFNIYRK